VLVVLLILLVIHYIGFHTVIHLYIFVINSTSRRCVGCWTRSENTRGDNGRLLVNIDSVSACQTACLSSSSCVAIDYHASSRSSAYCWLLTNTTTHRLQGFTHYVVNRQLCSSKHLSTLPSPSTHDTHCSTRASNTMTKVMAWLMSIFISPYMAAQ